MKKMIILAVLLVALLVPVTVFGAATNVDRLVVVEITADGESNVLGTANHTSRLNDLLGAFGFQLARTTDTIRTAVPNDGFVTIASLEAHLVNPNHIHISGMTGTILQRIRWSSGNYYADLADVAAWLGYTHHTSVTVGNTFYYVVVREGRDAPVGLFYIGETNLSLAPGGTMNLSNWLVNTTNVNRPTWASSNRNVATVNSNGVVTAVAAGTTNITVTARGGHRVTIALEVRLVLNDATELSINGLSRLFGGAEVEWIGTHFNVRPSRNANFYVTSNFPGAVFINGVEQVGEASFQARHWVIEIWPDRPATILAPVTNQTQAFVPPVNASIVLGTTTDVSVAGLSRLFGGEVVWTGSHFNVSPGRDVQFYVGGDFPGNIYVNSTPQRGLSNFSTAHFVIEIWPDNPATTATPTHNQTNVPAGAINITVAADTPIAGLRTAFGVNAEVTVGSENHVVVRPAYGVTINLTITSGDGDVLTGGASIVGTTRVVGHDNWIEFWS